MILRRALLAILIAATPSVKAAMTFENDPVQVIDKERFAGTWYSLMSIPTFLDKNWRQTIEHYTLREDRFDVRTTYRKVGDAKLHEIKSKLFLPRQGPMGALKAQFWWPIRVPYSIIAIAPDYSWMVGGSPDKKMLFILARTPSLPDELMKQIIARCAEIGYATDKLTSQQHGR